MQRNVISIDVMDDYICPINDIMNSSTQAL